MPTQTVPEPRAIKRQELADIESALSHLRVAIQSVYESVAHIPDDFYAHKCMEDHSGIIHRLTSMQRALEDRRTQLRILNSVPCNSCSK